MKPQLNAVAITNFRSLRGIINIPLQAPVVLIYGPNGAGKTSVLSAIELALTGELHGMRRTEPNYRFYLPHRGADAGAIQLTTVGVARAEPSTIDLIVSADGLEGTPLLDGDLGGFFSERCYLAQATLSRLLEIYQYPTKPLDDSPLTRFVKDLLGLDRLDALIDGLQPAGDIRNIRKLIPEYGTFEEAYASVKHSLATSKESLEQLRSSANALQEAVVATTASLLSQDETAPSLDNIAHIQRFLATDTEEASLVTLSGRKRELASLRQRSKLMSATLGAIDQANAAAEARAARTALDGWWQNAGTQLEALIGDLRTTFPDPPSVASTDPAVAFETASTSVFTELNRCERAVLEDDQLAVRTTELEQAIKHARGRIALADEQIAIVTGEAEVLGRALAALIPHIHTEDCPVCGRDYSEVSSSPLVARVSSQVAHLAEQANRLQSLGKARREATSGLTISERDREFVASRRLSHENRVTLKARIAMLTKAKQVLAGMAGAASMGAAVIHREATARQHIAELRNRDALSADLRTELNNLCETLARPPLDITESIADAIQRLDTYVTAQDLELLARQRARREAQRQHDQLSELRREIHKLEQSISADTQEQRRLDDIFAVIDRRRSAVKSLSRLAVDARTAIVGRVFNDTLNRIWRDLFVRLAPTEPFVPAFTIPRTASDPISAQLETVHRDGGKGGAPGAMLSAGNLNTAALTLFLALHLSMKPKLPWLILDDPVQSMDEVHLAQFAALLRTLAKKHERQILIAVHDRPLFNYLALELSPAFQGDQLITIELNRSLNGSITAEPTFLIWEPDRAVAA